MSGSNCKSTLNVANCSLISQLTVESSRQLESRVTFTFIAELFIDGAQRVVGKCMAFDVSRILRMLGGVDVRLLCKPSEADGQVAFTERAFDGRLRR